MHTHYAVFEYRPVPVSGYYFSGSVCISDGTLSGKRNDHRGKIRHGLCAGCFVARGTAVDFDDSVPDFFKLSWKEQYIQESVDEQMTYYEKLSVISHI